MREPGHWYVSYTVKSDDGSRRYARKTQTFETEELAKLFAREIVAENLRPTAGTINPHSPKKIISATDMANWLETPITSAHVPIFTSSSCPDGVIEPPLRTSRGATK